MVTIPLKDGFHAPAEWDAHAACLIGWPWRRDMWPYNGKHAQLAFIDLIRAICRSEKVVVIAKPGTFKDEHFRELSAEIGRKQVEVCPMLIDDVWLRDIGPTYVIRTDGREVRGVDWRFNKYGSGAPRTIWNEDAEVGRRICEWQNVKRYRTELVCEGGAIAFDGQGTVISTETVLLDRNRNPNMRREDIERVLLDHLGAEKVIWLPEGVHGDLDTSGHIDNMVAFVKPFELVLTWTDNESDPQYQISRRAEEILKGVVDSRGRKLTIHRLHQPEVMEVTGGESSTMEYPVWRREEWGWKQGKRLPASYVNFYIANGSVVVPQFDQPKWDKAALELLGSLFPEREVVGVQSRAILIGGGNIHCVTQQVPLCK